MGSIQNTVVHYCCVWKDGRVLYAYNGGDDDEIKNLAALCLEKPPSHHRWYFQTMCNTTFGFLMEDDGYVYFVIMDQSLGNPGNLEFLEHVRDEFKKLAKKGSNRSMSNLNSLILQEQLVRLITSLEHVAETSLPLSSPYSNDQIDTGASTKAPLLGKHSRQEKRKMSDHVILVTENGVPEEHTKSVDRGKNQGDSSVAAAMSLTKEMGLMKSRSSIQTVRNKWCRQVRIVLAVDVAVCLILFVVWMVVCRGTKCIR